MILSRFSKSAIVIAVAVALSLLASPSEAAVKHSVSISKVPAKIVAGQQITLTGKTTGKLKGSKVKIQFKTGSKWKTVKTVKSNKKTGEWTAAIKAPASTPSMSIRAKSGSKKTKVHKTKVMAPLSIIAQGPGDRILGVDLSRWQSIDESTIDFNRMAAAGAGFAFIKGSDGLASEDKLAVPHVKKWAPAAKAAGILVGYYHFARVPKTSDRAKVIASANAQAAQAKKRLDSLGGYDDRTLPYVLDIEKVSKATSQATITLWTFTWLEAMEKSTGKRPIIYSYRVFLASKFLTDATTVNKLRGYHLWLAQPGNPADPSVQVGQGLNGKPCFVTAWKQSDCTYVWTFWQYTNSGDRETYGIPWRPSSGNCPKEAKYCFQGDGTGRKHLDLNVFNGTAEDLSALVAGTWLRSSAEYR